MGLMLIRHSGFQKLVALLGLCAVLLGALEHEDLILQEAPEPASGLAAGGGFSSEDGVLTAPRGVDELATDSGTEGTFRSEHYRFWLFPRQSARYARLAGEPHRTSRRAALVFRGRSPGGPGRRGIVALRL